MNKRRPRGSWAWAPLLGRRPSPPCLRRRCPPTWMTRCKLLFRSGWCSGLFIGTNTKGPGFSLRFCDTSGMDMRAAEVADRFESVWFSPHDPGFGPSTGFLLFRREQFLLLKMLASRKVGCHFPLCCRYAQLDTFLGTTLTPRGRAATRVYEAWEALGDGCGGGWCGNIYTHRTIFFKLNTIAILLWSILTYITVLHPIIWLNHVYFLIFFILWSFNTSFICNCQGKGSNYC